LDRLYEALKSTDHRVLPSDALTTTIVSDEFSQRGPWSKIRHKVWSLCSWHGIMSMMFPPPQGIYIHGAVGVGKSFLMDLFYHHVTQPHNSMGIVQRRKHRRVHFHEFMLDVHHRIHQFRTQQQQSKENIQQQPQQQHNASSKSSSALVAVALQIAQESRVLCFDEFQVTDIADAMILKRLFTMLLDAGVVMVATSNRAPDELFQGGINRSLFLPFIDTLQTNLDVIAMHGVHGDYRKLNPSSETATTDTIMVAVKRLHPELTSYFLRPASISNNDDLLQSIFDAGGGDAERSGATIPVVMGRTVHVPQSNDTVAWFDFEDLCAQPLGAADYLALCHRYATVIVDQVPQLTSARFNEARRFVTLIDALYETKTQLILRMAEGHDIPSVEHLLVDFEVTVETNDGDEEIAIANNNATDTDEQLFVKGEGGSSSSAATTMIRTKDGNVVEWSATGRIGVSLAQLSAVQDVSFSFQRAESRLVEMTRLSWPPPLSQNSSSSEDNNGLS
jgi:protein AFG1